MLRYYNAKKCCSWPENLWRRLTIKKAAEKDRKYFNNRFETVSESIKSVEAMIVKEDDLIDLFQNYTLNVNISDKPVTSKRWVIWK